jgi:hypothetical protein
LLLLTMYFGRLRRVEPLFRLSGSTPAVCGFEINALGLRIMRSGRKVFGHVRALAIFFGSVCHVCRRLTAR